MKITRFVHCGGVSAIYVSMRIISYCLSRRSVNASPVRCRYCAEHAGQRISSGHEYPSGQRYSVGGRWKPSQRLRKRLGFQGLRHAQRGELSRAFRSVRDGIVFSITVVAEKGRCTM